MNHNHHIFTTARRHGARKQFQKHFLALISIFLVCVTLFSACCSSAGHIVSVSGSRDTIPPNQTPSDSPGENQGSTHIHDWTEWTVTQEETCNTWGHRERFCPTCGSGYGESVPPLGHDYVAEDTGPLCVQPLLKYVCTRCGQATKKENPDKDNHSYAAVIVTPTCAEGGYTVYTCACGKNYTDDRTKPLGHSFGEWVLTREETCAEEGEITRFCTCGESQSMARPTLPHTTVVTTLPATCTENGYTQETCTVCGYVSRQVLSATSHVVTDYISYVEPTCTQAGNGSGVCDICAETVDVEIAAKGHTASNEIALADDYCGDLQLCRVFCVDCEETLATVGHTYRETHVLGTCTEKGKTEYTCTKCESSYEVWESALGHYAGDWVVTHPASCVSDGQKARYCEICRELLESACIEASGHTYQSKPESGGVTYACACGDHYFVESDAYVTLSFICGGVKICDDLYIPIGTAATLPLPEKEKYYFDGWYLDAERTDFCTDSYVFYENATLYGVFREESISGKTETNRLLTDQPLDYVFSVKTDIQLTDENLSRYISAKALDGKTPKLYIVSKADGVYTIGSEQYQEGSSYQILLQGEVAFTETAGQELWFVTEKENGYRIRYQDDVVMIDKTSVYGCFESENGVVFFLSEDLLDAGDNAVVYGADIYDVLLIAEVLAEGRYENMYIYQIEVAEFDDIFAEYDYYYSGELSLDTVKFEENLADELTAQVMSSAVYARFRNVAARFVQGQIGNYYYDENGTKVKPSFSVSGKTIKLKLEIVTEFARMNVDTREVDSLFTVTLALENDLKFDFTVQVNSVDQFVFVASPTNTAKINLYASVKNKEDKDVKKELDYFKKLFAQALQTGKTPESDSKTASSKKETVIGSIPISISGITFKIELSNVFDFDAVGEAGVGAELRIKTSFGVKCTPESGYSTIGSYSASAQLSFYMLGKIDVSDALKIKFSVTLLGVIQLGFSASVGPYFEIGGMVSAVWTDVGVNSFVMSGFVGCGVKLEAKVGINLGVDYWNFLTGKDERLTAFEKEWRVFSLKSPIFSAGQTKVPLYFVTPEEKTELTYLCGSELNLASKIDTSVMIQDFDSMKKTTEKPSVSYYLNGSYPGISLTQKGVLSVDDVEEEKTLVIVVKVVYDKLYKLAEITLHINHNKLAVSYQAPTCTEDGRTEYTYCVACEEILAGEKTVIPATDHSYQAEALEATCEKPGGTRYICHCGDYYDEYVGVAKGHSYTVVVTNPTCTERGYTTHTCHCGDVFVDSYTAKRHTDADEDLLCDLCGADLSGGPASGYGLYDKDGYMIASWRELVNTYGMNVSKDYNNYTYKTDKKSPYYVLTNTDALAGGVKLVIGEVEYIGSNSFRGCTMLTSVTIPSSVTKIGSAAFNSCSNLTSVSISDLEAWCQIQFGSFSSNPSYNYNCELYLNDVLITDLVIPEGVTSIGNYAFYNYGSLTSVTIPNSVTFIGAEAFCSCENLASIHIPESVTEIGADAFAFCSSLTSVHITDIAAWCRITFIGAYSNPMNYAYDNKLYLNGVAVTDLVIPDGITSIKSYAFYNCYSLTNVIIPESVTSVGEMAFYQCYNVTLTLPSSLTSVGKWAFSSCDLGSVRITEGMTTIGTYAFYGSGLTELWLHKGVTTIETEAFQGCRKLKTIIFEGTVDEWNAITKKYNWNYGVPATEVQCSDGTVAL